MSASEPQAFFRHTLATLAYRSAKVLRDCPEGFAEFRIGPTSRSAGEILSHMGDLLAWAGHLATGGEFQYNQPVESWEKESERFFGGIRHLDECLASGGPLNCPLEKLFQGPIADALTHTGQLGQMRRLAGAPVRGENYFKADIAAGRTGAEQAPPNAEFD